MPIVHQQVTLGTAATEIVGHDNMPHDVILHNMSKTGNNYVFFGGSAVGTANAPHIDPGETIQFVLGAADRLFSLSDPAGVVVGVLDIRQVD